MPELAIHFQSDHKNNPDAPIPFTLGWVEAGTFTDPLPFTPTHTYTDQRENQRDL